MCIFALQVLGHQSDILRLRDGVPKEAQLENIVIDKSGHAKKNKGHRKNVIDSETNSAFSSRTTSATSSSATSRENIPPQSHRHFEGEDFDDEIDWKKIHEEKRLYKKKLKQASMKNYMDDALKRRLAEEVKAKELQQELYDNTNDESSEDEMEDTTQNPNWIAMKQGNKADKPEEWEALLQQRLTQELVSRELRKAFEEPEKNSGSFMSAKDIETENWVKQTKSSSNKIKHSKKSSEGVLSRSIFQPPVIEQVPLLSQDDNEKEDMFNDDLYELNVEHGIISATESLDSIQSEVLQNMMTGSSHSRFTPLINAEDPADVYNRYSPSGGGNISPCESVSSIDFRLQNEADEIYEMRHVVPVVNVHQTIVSDNGQEFDNEQPVRPLSPDSLISQDDFVKPPIPTTNIDRDALLFHQMQMARAQANAGSVASLDSIQSAPMNASRRDIFPDVKASSHSIEVLVNIGEDHNSKLSRSKGGSLSDSLNGGRIEWGSSMSGGSVKSFQNSESSHTLTGSRGIVDADSDPGYIPQENFQHSEHNFANTEINFVPCEAIEEEDSDRDTLVGDEDDVAIMESKSNNSSLVKTSDDVHDGVDTNDSDVAVSTAFIQLKQPGATNDYDESSDSDDSIGNVSLEDGYMAVEFHQSSQRTESMLNVLPSEPGDYPEVFVGNKSITADHQVPIFSSDERLAKHSQSSGEKDPIDNYETIEDEIEDDDAFNKEDVYDDDVNPYEDMHISPENILAPVSLNTSVDEDHASELPSEEDIDALYAKVNKIKMDKIRDEEMEPEDMAANLDQYLPILISPTEVDPPQKKLHHMSSGSGSDPGAMMVLDSELSEDEEIFMMAYDPDSLSKSNNSIATSSEQNANVNLKRALKPKQNAEVVISDSESFMFSFNPPNNHSAPKSPQTRKGFIQQRKSSLSNSTSSRSSGNSSYEALPLAPAIPQSVHPSTTPLSSPHHPPQSPRAKYAKRPPPPPPPVRNGSAKKSSPVPFHFPSSGPPIPSPRTTPSPPCPSADSSPRSGGSSSNSSTGSLPPTRPPIVPRRSLKKHSESSVTTAPKPSSNNSYSSPVNHENEIDDESVQSNSDHNQIPEFLKSRLIPVNQSHSYSPDSVDIPSATSKQSTQRSIIITYL